MTSPAPELARRERYGAFVAADPRRQVDAVSYGWGWTDDAGARWRASWAPHTGELYLVDSLGQRPDAEVQVLAVYATRAEVNAALRGWRGELPEPESVAWLREATTEHFAYGWNRQPEPVPDWAPDGSRAGLPPGPLRKAVGSYVARTGEALPAVAPALGLEAGYLAEVMNGEVAQVDARRVKDVADTLALAPEDLWGGEAAASISWVYGRAHVSDLHRAPPPPEPGRGWPGPDLGPDL